MPRSVDILDHWRARGTISAADFDVAQQVRTAFRIASAQGLDCRGAVPADRIAIARAALKRLLPLLGELDNHVLVGVICRGMTPHEAATAFGLLGDGENCSRRVRQALHTIAIHRWGTDREVAPIEIPEVVYVKPRAAA